MLSAYVVLCAIGSQAINQPFTLNQDQDQKVQTKVLLAPGTTAPDFTVERWGGGELKLSAHKGKIVVVDFLSAGAPGSDAALKHTESIYKVAKDQGLAVLEISTGDERPAFETWAKANEGLFTFSIGYDAGAKEESIAKKLYQVSDLPTTYIIDKDGKVAEAFVGYKENDTRLDNALRKLGLKIDQK